MENVKKTYITQMPDKAGAFLQASRIISKNGGNIVRVNYNKSVDVHTLFIEVNAEKDAHKYIWNELSDLGYLTEAQNEQKVILIVLKLIDKAGAVTPVLEIINNYDINVTYISSQETGTPYQYFKMGLLIDSPDEIKSLLDDISRICEVKIIDYDITEKSLDNTVFYITFANEMREILSLSQEKTNEVIINSNKIMQTLDERNELPLKTFDYIKQFAAFVVEQKGDNFKADIRVIELSNGITVYLIQPPCGSNTYIIKSKNELLFIDCGFACYKSEMIKIFTELLGDLSEYQKSIVITHTDSDHIGLLDMFDTVYMSDTCYGNFSAEHNNMPSLREQEALHCPYCKLSKIISGYTPPSLENCVVIGKKTDDELITHIGKLNFADLDFDVYEGCGGHMPGETVLVCEKYKIIFTGDIFVNAKGFTENQRQFNLLAPYLTTGINANSEKAKAIRKLLTEKYAGYTVFPGHGTEITEW